MAFLIGTAAASFLIHEKGVAHTFGLPLDSGWYDLTLGRSLFSGVGELTPQATESPGYAVVLGVIEALASYDQTQVVFAVKLLSILALSLTGWGVIRMVRSLPQSGAYALYGSALLVPLSPALVWLGVSGLGLAWGVAFVALGLADAAEGRPVRGTILLGCSVWMTPGALFVIAASFFGRKHRWVPRLLIAVGFLVPYAFWNLHASGWNSPFPGDEVGVSGFHQWYRWIRSFVALLGVPFAGGLHPMLLALFAGFGIWRARRDGRVLWLSVLLPVLFLGVCVPEPGVLGRLLFVCLPPLFGLAAIGVEFIARHIATGFLRGGRLAILVLALYVVRSGPNLWHVRQLFAWQVQNTVQVGQNIGRWVSANALPGEVVATTAPGAISYFSRHPVLDLTRQPFRHLPLDDILASTGAPWVAITAPRHTVPQVLKQYYRVETSVVFRIHAGVYPPGPMMLFRKVSGQGYAASERHGGLFAKSDRSGDT